MKPLFRRFNNPSVARLHELLAGAGHPTDQLTGPGTVAQESFDYQKSIHESHMSLALQTRHLGTMCIMCTRDPMWIQACMSVSAPYDRFFGVYHVVSRQHTPRGYTGLVHGMARSHVGLGNVSDAQVPTSTTGENVRKL